MNHLLYVVIFIFLLILNLNATIINVPADTSTIQGGIDMAVDGDTVLVQPGTYCESINFNGKNIVVGSLTLTTGDTYFISQTKIGDCSMITTNLVTFENGEDSTSVLCGFTITEGPRGIYIDNSNPKIKHLHILHNVTFARPGAAYTYGGGIYCQNANPQMLYFH